MEPRVTPRAREASPRRRAASCSGSGGSPSSDPAEPEPPLGGFPLCPECNENPVLPTGSVRRQRSDAELCGARCRKRRERRLRRERGQAAEDDPRWRIEEAIVQLVTEGRYSKPEDALADVARAFALPSAALRAALVAAA